MTSHFIEWYSCHFFINPVLLVNEFEGKIKFTTFLIISQRSSAWYIYTEYFYELIHLESLSYQCTSNRDRLLWKFSAQLGLPQIGVKKFRTFHHPLRDFIALIILCKITEPNHPSQMKILTSDIINYS